MILVENRDNDGAFIKRVVTDLDKSLHGVWRRDGEPIRFDSVGGAGQMPQEVERRALAVPYRPRLVAVIDSDRKGPGDSESGNARRLRETCERHGLPCWVLAKREAENYLPETLSAIEEHLFDDLPDADRETLATGFGPNLHGCWNLWHVREVRDELRTRGRGDLEHGIGLIRQEL